MEHTVSSQLHVHEYIVNYYHVIVRTAWGIIIIGPSNLLPTYMALSRKWLFITRDSSKLSSILSHTNCMFIMYTWCKSFKTIKLIICALCLKTIVTLVWINEYVWCVICDWMMRSINNTSIFSIESSIFVYVHDVCSRW